MCRMLLHRCRPPPLISGRGESARFVEQRSHFQEGGTTTPFQKPTLTGSEYTATRPPPNSRSRLRRAACAEWRAEHADPPTVDAESIRCCHALQLKPLSQTIQNSPSGAPKTTPDFITQFFRNGRWRKSTPTTCLKRELQRQKQRLSISYFVVSELRIHSKRITLEHGAERSLAGAKKLGQRNWFLRS